MTKLPSFLMPAGLGGVRFIFRRARTLGICLFSSAALILAAGAELRPATDAEGFGPAFELVRAAVDKGEIPGAIALVARNGVVLRQEAYGLRNIENQQPFTTNTLCWIASITKPVTVAAAMTLVDSGKLALDDALEKYLPEFRTQTDTNGSHHIITIRQLMAHTSGLVPNPPTRRSGWPLGGPLDDSWLIQRLPEIVQTIAQSQIRFKPGSKFEYSNSAFFVLGRVIEVVSRKPYAEYVREKILLPLGMDDTYYAPPSRATNRVAKIYARRDGQRETIFSYNTAIKITNTAPDGGLFSYPAQMVPFLEMFLEPAPASRTNIQDRGRAPVPRARSSPRRRVLSPSAIAAMLTEQTPAWGLGWSLPAGLLLHEGSSGTVAWADRKTGVIGVLFLQFRDQNQADVRVRKEFRETVQRAFEPGR